MIVLKRGEHALVKVPLYAAKHIRDRVGQEVNIVGFVKWLPSCDSTVFPGLSHYHVTDVHAAWYPSLNTLVVPSYCIPAAYLERTHDDCGTHSQATERTYRTTSTGTSTTRPGHAADGHCADHRRHSRRWTVARRALQGWQVLRNLLGR